MSVRIEACALIAAAAMTFAVACEKEPVAVTTATANTDGVTATTITSPAGPAAADTRAPEVTAAEARYLIEALQQGMGQIELAQSVSRRSDAVAVDQLAAEVIAAHNEVNAALARVAASRSVALAADAAPALRQTIARLEPLEAGPNLNAAYVATIVETYPPLIGLHDKMAQTTNDATLRDLAASARARFDANLRQGRAAYAQITGVVPSMTSTAGYVPPASGTR